MKKKQQTTTKAWKITQPLLVLNIDPNPFGPALEFLVLFTSLISEGSGKPAHKCASLPEPSLLAHTKHGSRGRL